MKLKHIDSNTYGRIEIWKRRRLRCVLGGIKTMRKRDEELVTITRIQYPIQKNIARRLGHLRR